MHRDHRLADTCTPPQRLITQSGKAARRASRANPPAVWKCSIGRRPIPTVAMAKPVLPDQWHVSRSQYPMARLAVPLCSRVGEQAAPERKPGRESHYGASTGPPSSSEEAHPPKLVEHELLSPTARSSRRPACRAAPSRHPAHSLIHPRPPVHAFA